MACRNDKGRSYRRAMTPVSGPILVWWHPVCVDSVLLPLSPRRPNFWTVSSRENISAAIIAPLLGQATFPSQGPPGRDSAQENRWDSVTMPLCDLLHMPFLARVGEKNNRYVLFPALLSKQVQVNPFRYKENSIPSDFPFIFGKDCSVFFPRLVPQLTWPWVAPAYSLFNCSCLFSLRYDCP